MRDAENNSASSTTEIQVRSSHRNEEYLLPNVCLQLVGFGKYPLEESVSFYLLDWVVYIHGGANANNAVEILAVSAETIAVGEKYQGVLPADKFTAHRKNGTVRIYGALLVQHLHGSLDRVQNHDMLAENLYMRDVPYMQGGI